MDRILKKVEVKETPNGKWLKRYFVADIGNDSCLTVRIHAECMWKDPKITMEYKDFEVWKKWREIPKKVKRYMTHEEIITTIQNDGALICHKDNMSAFWHWDTRNEISDHLITHDWRIAGIVNATWKPMEIEVDEEEN